jgi:hypothetical protein
VSDVDLVNEIESVKDEVGVNDVDTVREMEVVGDNEIV